MNPTHRALRDATAKAHDRADSIFGGFDLCDRAGYRAFLMAHADIVFPLEAALPGERIVADWPARKRGALLREDLAFLRDPGARLEPGAFSIVPETYRDDAAIAGTLYVLEGSRLGGRFLARQLPTGFPRAYLNTDQRPGAWQELLARLDQVLADPAALQTALAAADAVFAAFARSASDWLEKS